MSPDRIGKVPDTVSFNVTYDRRADVLYITTRAGGGDDARLDNKHGIVWTYDDDGELVGATIMNFFHRWSANQKDLTARISKRFHLPETQADVVLGRAFSSRGTH